MTEVCISLDGGVGFACTGGVTIGFGGVDNSVFIGAWILRAGLNPKSWKILSSQFQRAKKLKNKIDEISVY